MLQTPRLAPFRASLARLRGRSEAGQWLQAARWDHDAGTLDLPDSEEGSRFNPPGKYPLMYLAEDSDEARETMARWSSSTNGGPKDLVVLVYEVRLRRVLDLCSAAVRHSIGLTLGEIYHPDDKSLTQSLGIAAFREGYEGILYPRPLVLGGRNLGVFREQVTSGQIELMGRL